MTSSAGSAGSDVKTTHNENNIKIIDWKNYFVDDTRNKIKIIGKI